MVTPGMVKSQSATGDWHAFRYEKGTFNEIREPLEGSASAKYGMSELDATD
jgi:hypothetical protein